MGDADKIEISDEMIEAGLDAYYGIDPRVTTDRYRVAMIFEAMVQASRTFGSSSPELPDQTTPSAEKGQDNVPSSK